VEAAEDILDGRRDYTLGSLLRSAGPVIGPLLIAGILAGIGIGIGLVLLIVPGLFLLTIWAVIAPVIVIERTGAIEAFGRSRELVKGNGWKVFGVIVVLFLLQFIVSGLIQGIADSVSDTFAGYALADLLVRLLVAPLSAIAAAVLYFELKARRGEAVRGTDGGGQLAPAGEAAQPGGAQPGEAQPAPAPEAPPAPPPGPGPEAPPGPQAPRP
jgi:hypothetical protein